MANDSPAEKEKTKEKTRKSKPAKPLPTERLTVAKQLDILRAYAVASGPNSKAVTNDDIAGIVKIHPNTISLGNTFFYEIGFLQKGDKGYVPAPEVFEFNRAYEWNPDIASHKLSPIVSRAWFGEALLPKLSFRSSMTEEEAITTLAEAAAAGPDCRPQLRFLLDYLQAVGMILRDGNLIKLIKAGPLPPEQSAESLTAETKDRSPKPPPQIFSSPTEGVVQFHVSVKVDMKEFAGWEADRITAFFNGIAQVLAAKSAIEKDEN